MALWFGTWLRHFKRPIGLAIAEPEVQVISLCDKELCSFALDDILNGDCWLYVGPSSLLVFLWSFGETLAKPHGTARGGPASHFNPAVNRQNTSIQPLSPSVPCLTHLVFSLLHSHTWISSRFFVQHLCQHSRALSWIFFPLSSADIEDRYYIHVESSPPQRFPNFIVLHWIATSQPQYLDMQSYAFWFPHTLPNHNCSYRTHILRNQCP